ncbi:MAG: TrkH family potassium uptake protein [Acidimicrobiales bacterium]
MTTYRQRARRARLGDLRGPDPTRRQNLVLHVVGLSLAVAGVGQIVSAAVETIDGGPDVAPLLTVGVVVSAAGFALWRLTGVPAKIVPLDVFTTVTSAWLAMAVVGAVPYLAAGALGTFDDALFESVSGFTTTGATVLRPIEDASAGILFWRSISQWLGGMGVIVLVVAVLPTFGSGGMDLLEAEAPGPTGERLTPRVANTARRLWAVYVGFTVVVAAAYMVAGMSLYDGVSHSFTTVSTGGFSPYNRSIGHFESAAIEWIAIVAMFVAGSSFTLLFKLLRGSVTPVLQSIELRLYITVVLVAAAAVFVTADGPGHGADGVRHSLFAVLTVVSTTGYATDDFAAWSQAAQAILLAMMPVGAMAGSTAGGVKMIRVLAIASHAHRETLRHLHPRLVRPVRLGDSVLDDKVADRVLGFFVLALATFGSAGILMAMAGDDLITAFSASATLFGNVGPGLAEVGPAEDFLNLSRFGRLVGIGVMLLGRLEIYPILLALVALPLSGPRKRLARILAPLR